MNNHRTNNMILVLLFLMMFGLILWMSSVPGSRANLNNAQAESALSEVRLNLAKTENELSQAGLTQVQAETAQYNLRMQKYAKDGEALNWNYNAVTGHAETGVQAVAGTVMGVFGLFACGGFAALIVFLLLMAHFLKTFSFRATPAVHDVSLGA